MGFGFNLGMLFIVIPLTLFLIICIAITGKDSFIKILGCLWIPIIGLIILSSIIKLITPDNILDKEDYYGEYIIDRNYFSGKQADWQYNHFRMKITKNDSIFLYTIKDKKIANTYKGTITTVKPYNSERLVIHMERPNHHITNTNPTTYRQGWGKFYLVFKSEKFYNMYFKKGKWQELNSKQKKTY